MNLFALGLNHNTAPLALREKVAFSSEELDTANQKIRAMLGNPAGGGIKEVAILSTCNRTEIYCAAEDSELASKKLKEFLAESKGVKFNELEEHLYVFLNDDAARHAFRVASGHGFSEQFSRPFSSGRRSGFRPAPSNPGLRPL